MTIDEAKSNLTDVLKRYRITGEPLRIASSAIALYVAAIVRKEREQANARVKEEVRKELERIVAASKNLHDTMERCGATVESYTSRFSYGGRR